MKKVKAKLIEVVTGWRPVIYVAGRWRSFATPYSPKGDGFVPHMKKQNARHAADSMAVSLGFKLEWEG